VSTLIRTAIVFTALLAVAAADATAQKRCTKGIPCGNTCIAANKTCRVGSPTRPAQGQPNTVTATVPAGTQFVASSRGTTYYYVGCSAWKSLAPANRIYFKSVEEARAAGLRPSTQAGCSGPAGESAQRASPVPPISPDSIVGKCAYSRSPDELVGPIIGLKSDTVMVFRSKQNRTDRITLKDVS